jgi:hypothetical protein
MGLNVGDLVQLIDLRRAGVSFDSVITLGRQFTIGAPEEFARLLIEKGYPAADVQELVKQDLTYVDPILRFLGAQTVDSMDYSDYESATVIHDLNQPLPGHLKAGRLSMCSMHRKPCGPRWNCPRKTAICLCCSLPTTSAGMGSTSSARN